MKVFRILISPLKWLLPTSIISRLHSVIRPLVLKHHLAKLAEHPNRYISGGAQSTALMNRLVYGWGNPDWSADANYLIECARSANATNGVILECGSGLSTLIIGAIISTKNDTQLISIEHNDIWKEAVSKALHDHSILNVTIIQSPLIDYGTYEWYDVVNIQCAPISLVICDGPPGTTKGGRVGLLWTMVDYFASECVVLLDDCQRQEEMDILTAWSKRISLSFDIKGDVKRFAVIHLDG